jgi:AcrR family transcriptional regulator
MYTTDRKLMSNMSRRSSSSPAPVAEGRVNQRNRTRKAIVDATMTLLASGETPSVDAIAKAAEVSRRTVYMYFPTLDQLLLDATAGVLAQQALDSRLAPSDRSDDVESRVETLTRSVQGMSPELERLGRALIRLTVESGGREGSLAGAGAAPRRGYRRVEWIERALEPVRKQLDARRYERLVSALAMVIGWEALIVQRDIRGLSPAAGEELSVWAARALLRATLEEAHESPGKRSSSKRR